MNLFVKNVKFNLTLLFQCTILHPVFMQGLCQLPGSTPVPTELKSGFCLRNDSNVFKSDTQHKHPSE